MASSALSLLLCACIAVAAAPNCEPHCAHPCTELNGDIEYECGGCGGDEQCRPGAVGFGAASAEEPAYVEVDARTARAAAVGFSGRPATGSAPAPDAALYSAPATPEDLDEIRREGSSRRSCASAACARARLHALGRANEMASPSGLDNVTAGGDDVPCEFQRTSRDELLRLSIAERKAMLTSLPTVITGLTEGWPARTEWRDPQSFSARHGRHSLKAVRSGHGFERLIAAHGPACADPANGGACPWLENATMPLAEVVPSSDTEQVVIMDLDRGMARGEYELLRALSGDYEVPEFLDGLSNLRLFSLGGRPEGVQMSTHNSAWLAVLAGAKLWHLAPPSRPKPSNRYCPGRGKIDYALAAAEGVVHCMAYPGEVVVVPDDWWHATCNMLPYTVAIGGQTWDASVRTRFAARTEAEWAAVHARLRRRAPRPVNRYQGRVGLSLVEGEPLPALE